MGTIYHIRCLWSRQPKIEPLETNFALVLRRRFSQESEPTIPKASKLSFKYGSLVTVVCTRRRFPPTRHHIKLKKGSTFYSDYGKITHEVEAEYNDNNNNNNNDNDNDNDNDDNNNVT